MLGREDVKEGNNNYDDLTFTVERKGPADHFAKKMQ
jgi:hypothetical protein